MPSKFLEKLFKEFMKKIHYGILIGISLNFFFFSIPSRILSEVSKPVSSKDFLRRNLNTFQNLYKIYFQIFHRKFPQGNFYKNSYRNFPKICLDVKDLLNDFAEDCMFADNQEFEIHQHEFSSFQVILNFSR